MYTSSLYDMSDEDDTADAAKASKRSRLRGAIERTKTKLKKREPSPVNADSKVSDEIADFLSAGRKSSAVTPSLSDPLSFTSDRPSTSDSLPTQSFSSPRTSVNERFDSPQPSPRRIIVPRIDVSQSQRYPGTQPLPLESVDQAQERDRSRLLKPYSQSRSQSVSALSKGSGRRRGLSVSFLEAPPAVIGEGGDEAETAPIEISRARIRARSASPTSMRTGYGDLHMERKPVPQHERRSSPEFFQPKQVRRAQTGFETTVPERKLAIDKEFEMSLGLGPAPTYNAPVLLQRQQQQNTITGPIPIHAPRPIHPPLAAPVVREVKPVHASNNLRQQFAMVKAPQRDLVQENPYTDLAKGNPFASNNESRYVPYSEKFLEQSLMDNHTKTSTTNPNRDWI